MNKYPTIGLALVLALSISIFTGCTTTDPVTGDRVFDPVKTELLTSTIEDGLAEIVYWTAKADDNTASAYRIASNVIDTLITDGAVTNREEIRARLLSIQIGGMTEADSRALILRVSDIVLGKWDIIVKNYIRVGVSSNQAANIAASTIKNGVNRGLLMLGE